MCVHVCKKMDVYVCRMTLKITIFKVYEDSPVRIKLIYTNCTRYTLTMAESEKLTIDSTQAVIEKKHLSMPAHWEWTSFSRVSYPWNIWGTHFHHKQSRKKQRSKDSCCGLMTLSSFEWVPFSKELFHITAWNPFRQYDGHLRSASTRILWLWVGFEKHNTFLSAELSARR